VSYIVVKKSLQTSARADNQQRYQANGVGTIGTKRVFSLQKILHLQITGQKSQ
jgi:hypothetical protein